MLGKVTAKAAAAPWRFAAFGKHPAAKDFIRLGEAEPVLEGLARWAEAGYEQAKEKRRPIDRAVSWRFWSRGSAPGAIACGLVRDSADRLGRPHPLLLAGAGFLPGWERHWDLLPCACMPLWDRFEHIAARNFGGAADLEAALGGLLAPPGDWEALLALREREAAALGEKAAKAVRPEEGDGKGKILAEAAESEGCRFVALFPWEGGGPLAQVASWQRRLRRDGEEAPVALFVGGTLLRTFAAVFRRPLSVPDFVRLWEAAEAETPEGRPD